MEWKKMTMLALTAALILPWAGAGLEKARSEACPADAVLTQECEPKLIALTFDDGPRRSTTTELLDGLAQRGVRATFFLIGEQVPGNEDLLRRMDEEGHQIGIHTYDHVMLTGLNAADFSAQVDRTRTVLKNALGHNDFLLRPPYGMVDDGVKRRAGCPIILWSVDPEDWDDKNTDRIVEHVVSRAKDGDIILLHDIYPTSVEAALRIVDALHQKGFYFLTVDELAAQRRLSLKAGTTYLNFYP
ncbi:MAG: polysaccharide deacetylase family protein [Oscillospiraceae bacterium]